MQNVTVAESNIRQPAAIRPGYVDAATIGKGQYNMEAFFLGGGFVYKIH